MTAGGGSLDNYAWSPDASKLVSNNTEGPQALLFGPNAVSPRANDFAVELARARLDQAEQEMDSLKSRLDYLEARAGSSVGATQRELEELMQVRDALGAGAAEVGGLSNRLDQLTRGMRDWKKTAVMTIDILQNFHCLELAQRISLEP